MSIKGNKYNPDDQILHSIEKVSNHLKNSNLNELVSFELDPSCVYNIKTESIHSYNKGYHDEFEKSFGTTKPFDLINVSNIGQGNSSLKLSVKEVIESRLSIRINVKGVANAENPTISYELTIKPIAQCAEKVLLSFRPLKELHTFIDNGDTLEALRSQSLEYKALLDTTPAGFIKTDLDGKIMTVAAKTSYLLGHDSHYFLDKPVQVFLNLNKYDIIERVSKKLISQKKGLFNSIAIAKHSSGKDKLISLNVSLITDVDEAEGFLFSYIDITNDHFNKEKLKATKNKFKEFIEYSPTGIVQIDLLGKLKYCSPSALQIFSIDKSEVKNNLITDLIHCNSQSLFATFIKRVKANGSSKLDNILRINNEKGELVFVEISGKVLSHNTVEGKSILLMLQDLSDHVRSEIALIEQESLMHNILERTPISIYAIDRNYKIIFANKNAKEDFKSEYGIDLFVGLNLENELSQEDFKDNYQKHYNKVLKGKIITDITSTSSNNEKIHHTRYYPLKQVDGTVYCCMSISQDITHIKNNEIQLEERQAYLSTILNSSPDGICVIDRDYRIAVANPKLNELYLPVYNIPFNIGDNINLIIPNKDFKKINKAYEKVFSGKSVHIISKFDVDKEVKYYDSFFAPVRDIKGKIIGCIQVVRDFTENYLKEKQIKISEKKYRELVDFLPCGIAIINNSGDIIYLSHKTKSMFGITEDENAKDMSFYELFHQSKSYIDKVIADNVDNGSRYSILPLTSQCGETKSTIELKTKKIEYDNEPCLLVVLFDITEKIKASKDKEERQKIYEALIENSLDGIDIIELESTVDGSFESVLKKRNKNMLKYFGSDDSYYTLTDILDAAPEYQPNGQSTKEMVESDVATFIQNGQIETERLIYDKNKSEKFIQLSAQLLDINEKKIIIRNYKDITEKKLKGLQIESNLEEINNKKIQLEKYIKSNYDLQNFAFIASHDLKAPLRTILSFSKLLKRSIYSDLPDKERVFMDIILRSSKSMEDLIEDLLKFSDVNSSEVSINKINTSTFIQDLLINISSDIEEAKATIEINNLPPSIHGDKIKLSQLFQNLIRNGIKFHKKNVNPIISISAKDLGLFWQFSISDNGIGIAEEFVSEIFTIFKTLNEKSDYKGHGIGLSICQQIVSKHNGDIWVDSIEGEGSTFSFTIKK